MNEYVGAWVTGRLKDKYPNMIKCMSFGSCSNKRDEYVKRERKRIKEKGERTETKGDRE